MEPVTLRAFLSLINKIGADRPDLLDKPVISSSDDEGNSFSYLYFHPTVGRVSGQNGGLEFIDDDTDNPNTVCIN